ncbi:MAG: 30S ribosome-binding factor RbfA [Bacillota bacterium]
MSQRHLRVAEEMKKEIADILQNEVKDPRVGFVTITSVELSTDLRNAKIFVSIFGDEEKQRQCLEALHKATGFVRREIGQRIKLRHTPELVFKFDSSIEHGDKIARLLSKVVEPMKGNE